MLLAEMGGSIIIDQNKITKEFFEQTLNRVFKSKYKDGKYRYEVLNIMKKNMQNNSETKSNNEIEKIINYFLKEF